MEEFVAHRDKYNPGNPWWPTDNSADINNKFNNAKNWAKGRPDYFYKHIGDQWKLGSPVGLTINKSTKADIEITFNGIKMSNNVFDGKYFKDLAMTISGGEEVKGWRLSGAISEDVAGSVLTINMTSSPLKIEPLFEEVTGIQTIENSESSIDNAAIYDLLGNKITTPQTGRIYIQNGKKITWQ
jgi:hypothetical protein